MFRKFGAAAVLASMLSACGGGGDGCSAGLGAVLGSTGLCNESSNQLPLADAGRMQNVAVGAVVTLDGSFSRDPEGQTLAYIWDWVSKPVNSAALLASGNAVKAAFVADVAGTYVLSLVVSDGKVRSAPVNVTVNASTTNSAPVASAGLNQSVVVGQAVRLDGSGSTDADRQPISFQWRLISRPAGSSAALTGEATARPVFTADVAGVYAASLVVSDGLSSSEPVIVTVTAGVANVAPVAHAGINKNVVMGSLVTLDGSASSDANRDPLTYKWTVVSKPAGSAANLSSDTDVRPVFMADRAGTYVYSLSVSDGQLRSDFAAVSVVATSVNAAPVAVVGLSQSVVVGSTVTLDGSGSSDANRDPLTYQWSLTSKPAGSAAVLVNPGGARPSFTADMPGTYVFNLVVNDGMDDSNVAVSSVVVSRANAAPVAVAGPEQSVLVGSSVTLNGSGSTDANRDPLTYRWALVTRPAGSNVSLSSASSVMPTFTADVAGNYVFSLIVNDGLSDSQLSVVSVTAGVANAAPVANAGLQQNVVVGRVVTLDGSASSDANRDPLTYKWTVVSKPVGSAAALSSDTEVRPVFTADLAGTYVFSLSVSDGQLRSDFAAVSVLATSVNAAPVAVAGRDQSVLVGTQVSLDGSASADANRDPLTYLWALVTKPTGSGAALSGPTLVRPTFTADVAGTYVFSLIVNDGMDNSAVSNVVVVASQINAAPVASAGPDQTVAVNTPVILDGSASSDANRDVLYYNWQMVARPAGSNASLTGPTTVKPVFTPDSVGTYVFSLVVSDGTGTGALSSQPDLVVVTVVPANVRPVAVASGPATLPVARGATVTVNGTASTDANGDTLTYRWSLTRPTGSAATLAAATNATTTFVADVAGTYVATLIVNDGKLDSEPVVLVITAGP